MNYLLKLFGNFEAWWLKFYQYNSIENRSPYLDKEIFNFALNLPANFLIEDGYQKIFETL